VLALSRAGPAHHLNKKNEQRLESSLGPRGVIERHVIALAICAAPLAGQSPESLQRHTMMRAASSRTRRPHRFDEIDLPPGFYEIVSLAKNSTNCLACRSALDYHSRYS
jgi:hypothetical protein